MFEMYDHLWAEVDYADHPIRPWCKEERCWYCRDLATHKIEECDVRGVHPHTAYVCCAHFFGACSLEDALGE